MTTDTPPPTTVAATAHNRARTVAVRATESGLPLDVLIDARELQYGGPRLADQILRLCQQAAREAGARRREELARDGVPAELLDRLGLPTRDQVAAAQQIDDESHAAPLTWMRPV
ncbi:hypothetical protein ERC79_05150 [Rhodococcus sp. ABRD24]|uniref:hypothetical protein n=1 Tax=Rhodococcus sp. ABRD24 TaxID=2507582 RepID=UPI00103A4D69|nr:hypothetical protein [Rhodococcus sp. ABRD24]QBJ95412.1 hypothetical protein ERC79_05150 [Rhodococcus sp. ABRD24]